MRTATQTAPAATPAIAPAPKRTLGLIEAFTHHWPEYACEAALIALFMLSASAFGALYEHPRSPVHQAIDSQFLRRALMGLSMGATAIALIYSPFGKRSGAHYNPSVTLTFLRLRKIGRTDALFYVAFQLLGSAVGVSICYLALGDALSHPAVHFVTTVPGASGATVAFVAELFISFLLMTVVLVFASRPASARYTGFAAGLLVATFITVEAPYSGMSMNFARTFGSAVVAHIWKAVWVYLSAPLLGMLLAGEVHSRLSPRASEHCAKLHHDNHHRCIFCGANGGFLHDR